MAQSTEVEHPETTRNSSETTENKGLMSSKNPPVDWVAAIFIVSVHIIALIGGILTFSWAGVLLCLAFHFISGGLGITLCYHRLLTHASFKVPRVVEFFLTMCAALACQAGPITWVASHRLHHAKSDQEGDPHSPLKSFYWAHMGWCFHDVPGIDTLEGKAVYAPDLFKDPMHRFFEKTHILWTFLLGIGLYAWGGWPFVIWGIFVRLVFVYHCTWLVNSAAHVWGYRTYDAKDQSTNLWWVALLSYGEGWHNNHHAFQTSARHGLRWWEFDTTYLLIKTLEFFKLASAVKVPTEHQLASKAQAS